MLSSDLFRNQAGIAFTFRLLLLLCQLISIYHVLVLLLSSFLIILLQARSFL